MSASTTSRAAAQPRAHSRVASIAPGESTKIRLRGAGAGGSTAKKYAAAAATEPHAPLGDGSFAGTLSRLAGAPELLDALFDELDADGDGVITLAELYNAVQADTELAAYVPMERVRTTFETADISSACGRVRHFRLPRQACV